MKTCTRCQAVKPYELFYKQSVNSKDGYQSHCKACDNERKKTWALKNPDLAKLHRKISDVNRYKNHKSYYRKECLSVSFISLLIKKIIFNNA